MKYFYDTESLINALTSIEHKGAYSVEVCIECLAGEQYIIFNSSKYRRTLKAEAYPERIEDFMKGD